MWERDLDEGEHGGVLLAGELLGDRLLPLWAAAWDAMRSWGLRGAGRAGGRGDAAGHAFGVRLGYATGAESLVALSALSLGVLLARPDRGWFAALASDSHTGMMLRRVLPAAIALPVGLATLTLAGQRLEAFSTAVGVWLLVGAVTLAFVTVAWLTAAATRRADQTRRQAAQATVRLAAIVDSSDDAIIGKDRDGVITVWNPGATRLYGYAPAEVIGQPITLLLPPEHRGEDRELLARVLGGEHVAHYQTERVCKDRSVVDVSLSLSAIHDMSGQVIGASSIARDVTSMTRAQEQIALQAELLDEVDAAVTLTDREGRVRFWSRGAQHLFGYDATEAIGQRTSELIKFKDESPELQSFRRDAQVGGRIGAELDVRDKHGRVFPAYVRHRLIPLRVDGHAVTGLISVGVDITDRRNTEQTLRRHAAGQEEIAELGRLAIRGAPMEELFDRAVDAAWRVLSSDCAWLLERSPNSSDPVLAAEVGWTDPMKGERIAGEGRSLFGYAARSGKPVIIKDWEQERRFPLSRQRLARGVRSSIGVPVGDPAMPFGVLEVQYTTAQAVPANCLPFLDALTNVLAEALESRRGHDLVRYQALHDGLTGLPNRTLLLDRVTRALDRTDRHPQPLAVLFIDLDNFKLINDSLGHEAGDELLKVVATRLARETRRSDTLARLGGDEFAVLCEELSSELNVTCIADRLLSSLAPPVRLGHDEHTVSASIGIALSSSESSAADLLRDADAAMYHAKMTGRGRSELFDTAMRARVLSRVHTEAALRIALTKAEDIYLHYQPLVSLNSGRIVGAEALARWQHPDWGPVSPLRFIAVAEDSGLIHELGAYLIRRAAHECAAWQDTPDLAAIAVNVSTRQLVRSDEVPTLLTHVLADEGIAPGFLTVEITESLLIAHLTATLATLRSLRNLGVRLSLDDFGTGYSSLSYLRDLPLDSVKIDRSLIKDIMDSSRAADLVAAIIGMGHALDLQVVAEGVETRDQAALLQSFGCDIGQGYYFAKPMAPEELTALLGNQPDWLSGSISQR